MAKVIQASEAARMVQDGAVVMIGGFLAVGSPHNIIECLLEMGTKDLTVIANDTSFVDRGIGKLIVTKQIKHAIVSHVGTNKETGNQMNAGETKVTLVPQGSLAEKIRAYGAGLGGVLTPTGVGTVVAEGKQEIEIQGKKYLLEEALGADIALIKAYKADTKGNLVYRHMARNFNPLMATAAKVVIVEAEHIVEAGELLPDEIVTPGIFVDYIVQSEVSK